MSALWKETPFLTTGYIHLDEKIKEAHKVTIYSSNASLNDKSQMGISKSFHRVQTLVHGDLHTNNIFFDVDAGVIRLIDLQYIHCGNPMEDVAFFLSTLKNSPKDIIPLLQ